MAVSLKNKAIKGFKWSFIDTTVNMGLHFIIGIILARLLSPAEFGLVGMVTVLLALSQEIVDSGLTQSLIRKPDCLDIDYNTAFFTNLAIGVACCLIMYLSSTIVSEFYGQDQLKLIAKVLSVNIVISSFGVVETAILKKRIDFKLQTIISLSSTILSGAVGIILAFQGFGVWSLVWKTLALSITRSSMLMLFSKWKPKLQFSFSLLKEHFRFGSRVLVSGFLETIYKNILYIVIGKWFSATQLGFYTRAQQFIDLPSKNFTTVIQRVSYPVLVSINKEGERLNKAYRHLVRSVFLASSIIMMLLIGLSREVVLILIGEKWISIVPYMNILCLAGLIYPVLALNNNMMLTKNKPTQSLGFQVITKILMIPVVTMGILFGMKVLLYGIVCHSAVSLMIIGSFSGNLIGYKLRQQLFDIAPIIGITGSMLLIMQASTPLWGENLYINVIGKSVLALLSVMILARLLKVVELFEMLRIALDQLYVSRIFHKK